MLWNKTFKLPCGNWKKYEEIQEDGGNGWFDLGLAIIASSQLWCCKIRTFFIFYSLLNKILKDKCRCSIRLVRIISSASSQLDYP
jgi:hypothetical protein